MDVRPGDIVELHRDGFHGRIGYTERVGSKWIYVNLALEQGLKKFQEDEVTVIRSVDYVVNGTTQRNANRG